MLLLAAVYLNSEENVIKFEMLWIALRKNSVYVAESTFRIGVTGN